MTAWEFDFFYSVPFWAALPLVAAIVRIARANAVRSLALLASSSALLLAMPRFRLRDLLLVWAVAGASLLATRRLCRPEPDDSRRRRWIAGLGIAAVLGVLAFFKYHAIQDLVLQWRSPSPPAPSDYLFLVGVSYFSFKAIHVVTEAFKRSVTQVRPVTYFNYLTFFPAFISGPINRYGQFAEQLEAPPAAALGRDLASGGERIVHGLFKKLVLVPVLLPYILTNRPESIDQLGAGGVAVGLYAYALYFYFDFSGYSDLAIGGARIMGFVLPENFANPFFQRNIREFWSSWHISLTSWLVDYVYWPVVRRLRNLEYFRPRPVLLSIVGMNITFLACGVWHGEAVNFVLWGAYHGLGISVLNVYQRQKKRIRNKAAQRYFASRYSRAAGAFLTFNFFSLGLALFVLDLGRLRALAAALLR